MNKRKKQILKELLTIIVVESNDKNNFTLFYLFSMTIKLTINSKLIRFL